MSLIATIVHWKELIIEFYRKHADILIPLLKALFSYASLVVLYELFPYGSGLNNIFLLLIISIVQAFLPVNILFFTGFATILASVWNISIDVFVLFVIVMLIYLVAFVRSDKTAVLIFMLTPILFFFKLEYFLPVILGMMIGYSAILPCLGGIILYFLSNYTLETSIVLTTSETTEIGVGLQRIFNLIYHDMTAPVLLIAFGLTILLSAGLAHMLYERAWTLSLVAGNIVLALAVLLGNLFFSFDLNMFRLFLEIILAIGLGNLIMLFKGIGDVSRIEKVSFEDDEYIYYVKAVPKMKITQKDVNKKIINQADEPADEL